MDKETKQPTVSNPLEHAVMCKAETKEVITCDKQFKFLRDKKDAIGSWKDCKVSFVGSRYTIFIGSGGKEYSRPSDTVLIRDKVL